jgi:hypothetical protein
MKMKATIRLSLVLGILAQDHVALGKSVTLLKVALQDKIMGGWAGRVKAFLQDAKIKLYVSKGHIPDFLSCVAACRKLITCEQVGGRRAICCHLMTQVYHHGWTLKWDPAKFKLTVGTGDPNWLTRGYRSPWSV